MSFHLQVCTVTTNPDFLCFSVTCCEIIYKFRWLMPNLTHNIIMHMNSMTIIHSHIAHYDHDIINKFMNIVNFMWLLLLSFFLCAWSTVPLALLLLPKHVINLCTYLSHSLTYILQAQIIYSPPFISHYLASSIVTKSCHYNGHQIHTYICHCQWK
jgi:hypothetical protein